MKITRRDLGVIMILVGVMVIFLTYRMSFVDMQEKVEELQAEQSKIRSEISDLQPIMDNAGHYQSEMKRFQTELDEMVKEFPVSILMEDNIMYVVQLENDLKIEIPSFSATEAAGVSSVEGAGALAGRVYSLGRATLNFGYTVESYDDLKEFLNYVYDDKDEDQRLISSIGMSFDSETGEISGSVALNMYAMNDGTRQYEPQELPLKQLGVDNIFGEVTENEDE